MEKVSGNQPALNYHHLFYFMTIATEGGVAKAAQKLRLGQSTLSTQLIQLENSLGVALFERRKKRLHLTEEGLMTLNYAESIFRLGDELLDTLHDRRQSHRLRFQLGVSDSIAKPVVLELLAAAQAIRPCMLSVTEGVGSELLRALAAHELDLVLLNHAAPVGERNDIHARLAARMPIVILGAKQFKPLRRGFPESIASQPFIMPGPHSKLRYDLDNFLKLRRIQVDIVFEVQDASLKGPLAAQGLGLIPVAKRQAAELMSAHDLIEIGALDEVSEELWLLGSERRFEHPIAAQLLKDFKL